MSRPGPTVEVDRELEPREVPMRLVDMVAYAGATWDWHRMHHDHQWAMRAGFPGPVVDGQVLGALLVEQAQDAFGPRARMRHQSFRFHSVVVAGEVVRLEARVVEVDGDLVTLRQAVQVREPAGERLAATGRAIVEVPGASG